MKTGKPTTVDEVKRVSWSIAKSLLEQNRITLETAAWALKESRHSREEVERFIKEARKEALWN